jgi:hypothetical protein
MAAMPTLVPALISHLIIRGNLRAAEKAKDLIAG